MVKNNYFGPLHALTPSDTAYGAKQQGFYEDDITWQSLAALLALGNLILIYLFTHT